MDIQMHPISVGDCSILRLVEFEGPTFFPHEFLIGFDPELLREYPFLSTPDLIEPGAGRLMLSFHCFVVRTPRHTILIDTCAGNDKQRPGRDRWHMLQTAFLRDLESAGVPAASVDYVLCTHLHWDHVGWNTMLIDGRWRPTFPNAKYIVDRSEFDHWHSRYLARDASLHVRALEDSVLPLAEAGQLVLVDDGFRIDDNIFIERAVGHTPGSVVIHLESLGQKAVFSGDVFHHPIQVVRPEWSSIACVDPAQSARTRRRFLENHCDSGRLVLPAHFPAPTAGHICNCGNRLRFNFIA